MLTFKEVFYLDSFPKNQELLLVGDIGGTNCNFGLLCKEDSTLKLVTSFHFATNQVIDFTDLVSELLDYLKQKFDIEPTAVCFGAAGVISEKGDLIKLTNAKITIDINEIIKKTKLKKVIIKNDFEILANGIDLLDKKDLLVVNKGEARANKTKAVIGAGTGVGKCMLVWDKKNYIMIPSEGGHADFPIKNALEYELVTYIKKTQDLPVTWETLISGRGIIRIYKFFEQIKKLKTNISKDVHENAYVIFDNWQKDECANATFRSYSAFYGRCAKNFALETLSLSGLFIAGGIAAKNPDLFKQEEFNNELFEHSKLQDVLKQIPVTIILNYNVSLYGAASFLLENNA